MLCIIKITSNLKPQFMILQDALQTVLPFSWWALDQRPLNASCAAVGVNAILDLTSAEHHFKRKLSPTDNEQKD